MPYTIIKFLLYSVLHTKNLFFEKREIVVINSMGKVGSTTIINSLKSSLPNHLILQVHHLNFTAIFRAIKFHLKNEKSIPHNLVIGLSLNLYNRFSSKKLTVISLIREPISRAISNYFQMEDRFYDNEEQRKNYEFVKANIEKDINDLTLKNSYYNTWFDENMKSTFKFDVFQFPYDPNRGILYQKDNLKIAILRMEDIDHLWPNLFIRLFPKHQLSKITDSNISLNKPSSNLYLKIKKYLKIENEVKSSIFKSKTVTHFYRPDELIKISSNF